MHYPLIVLLLLGGCSTTEYTVLLGPRRVGNDSEPGLFFSVMQPFGKHGICGYIHGSDHTDGKPFNDESENTFDQAGCGLRFGGAR